MSHRGRIVVIEDDPAIARLVELYLQQDGFEVMVAGDGRAGLDAVRDGPTVLAIVDLGLPGGLDGIEVCRRIRSAGDLPLMILSARRAEDDRVDGLEVGADDYVTKPFSPRELIARIHALLRRSPDRPPADAVVDLGPLVVDPGRHEVRVGGRPVPLTPREYELVAFLARHRGQALSRDRILDGAWGPGWYGDDRTVDVHVRQLRAKLGDALPLTTVRGVGYRLG